jgi:uncharacterized protein (TIGR02452 family)
MGFTFFKKNEEVVKRHNISNSSSNRIRTKMVVQPISTKTSFSKSIKTMTTKACHERLSFSRTHFQQLAEENAEIAKKGKYLNNQGNIIDIGQSLNYSIQNSKHYHHSENINPPSDNATHDTRMFVCYGLTVKAALKLVKHGGKHVGVLNSAHATKPGEKFLSGCLSLESCICRGSLLWPCLTQFENKKNTIYTINKSDEFSLSPSSCAIYSPDVPIIRQDALQADMLDEYQKVSFVSLPPPNAFELADDKLVRSALKKHIYRALCIFAENKCEDLVLCAYGCGTRGNEPKMVAEVFKDILSNELKGHFSRVVFAINPRKEDEYQAFASVFEN